MEKIKRIILNKKAEEVLLTAVYTAAIVLVKWGIKPSWDMLWFVIGATIGLFLFEIGEELFKITPSPFRSILFYAGFLAVAVFVVTSSGNPIVTGLILAMYIDMADILIREWHQNGKLDQSWFNQLNLEISAVNQRNLIYLYLGVFVFLTFQFIRQF